MALVKFVRNYQDLSTERGFQFEFCCDRCGGGCQTSFQPSATGLVSEALDTVGSLLGGVFSSAATVGDRVHSVAWERAHDGAFEKAVAEAKPHFVQCPKCVQWVCRDGCWNAWRGLCKECAPDLGVEQAAAEAQIDVEQVRASAQTAQHRTALASCPSCGAAVNANGKFCPQCGAALSAEKPCVACGSQIPVVARFCPECGAKAQGR